MNLEYALIGLFVAFVASSFTYLLKVEDDPALKLWTFGWCSVGVFAATFSIGTSLDIPLDHPALAIPTYLSATLLPFFLVAGAMAYVGQPIPAWLRPAAIGIALLRAGLAVADLDRIAQWIVFPTEVAVCIWGALLFLRSLPTSNHKVLGVGLAMAYIGAAGWEGGGAIASLSSPVVSAPLTIYGSIVAGGLVVLQLLAVLARVRDREMRSWHTRARDLEILREVAAQGVRQQDTSELIRTVLESINESVDPDISGVWLMDEDGSGLRCVAHSGLSPELRERFEFIPVDRPEARAALALERPFISQRLEADERVAAVGEIPEVGLLQAGVAVPMEWEGERRGFLFAGRQPPRVFADSDLHLLIAVAQELSLGVRHLRAVEHLASERRTLRSVLETSPVGVVVQDGDGRISMLSLLAARLFDCGEPSDWIGRLVTDWIDSLVPRLCDRETTASRILSALRSDDTDSFELFFDEPQERSLVISTNPVRTPDGEALGRIWVARDTTEERRLGEQLRQSQKLDTLGRLAGGVAHDFNNQLTAILGNARFVADRMAGDEDAVEAMLDLERAADHCAKLTRSLLSFSRRAPLSPRPIFVADLLNEVRSLLRPLLPSHVELHISIAPEIDLIAADLTQMQQVLLNLAMNASDAIEGPGEVRIEAANSKPPRGIGKPSTDSWVRLSVSDTGSGMPPSTMERIFEPFFTTKPLGQGTGLGLAIVYGVVSAHRGHIEVESRLGRGTAFHVYLPAESDAAEVLPESPREATVRGTELILVVDDEAGVRRFARRSLESCGFRVLEAGDGDEAVEVFRANSTEIDLVLLDLAMPKRSGLEVLREVRAIAPEIAVLLSSGNESDSLEKVDGPVEFIPKPYDPDDLARRIRGILDAR